MKPPSAPPVERKTPTHLDAAGNAHMVNVADKEITVRRAVARGVVRMLPSTVETLQNGVASKGDVLAAARIAGIMAAKRTPELIPLCHGVQVTRVTVDFETTENSVIVRAEVSARDRTGVEMEAMTAVSVAALTLYDMLKSVDRWMEITGIVLIEKEGGRSGHLIRPQDGEHP